jgi:hypothetical protein
VTAAAAGGSKLARATSRALLRVTPAADFSIEQFPAPGESCSYSASIREEPRQCPDSNNKPASLNRAGKSLRVDRASRGAKQSTEVMPRRASHLPTHIERTALQKLRERGELTELQLEPTRIVTIAKMMIKGWVENGCASSTYRITRNGEEALRTPIPLRQRIGRYAQR